MAKQGTTLLHMSVDRQAVRTILGIPTGWRVTIIAQEEQGGMHCFLIRATEQKEKVTVGYVLVWNPERGTQVYHKIFDSQDPRQGGMIPRRRSEFELRKWTMHVVACMPDALLISITTRCWGVHREYDECDHRMNPMDPKENTRTVQLMVTNGSTLSDLADIWLEV